MTIFVEKSMHVYSAETQTIGFKLVFPQSESNISCLNEVLSISFKLRIPVIYEFDLNTSFLLNKPFMNCKIVFKTLFKNIVNNASSLSFTIDSIIRHSLLV